jgi:hypothetical protein
MAKRKNTKWFWNAQVDEATLFPNTAKQRAAKEKLALPAKKEYDKDGVEIIPTILEDEYWGEYSDYYGGDDWNRSWKPTKGVTSNQKAWDDYEKTGVWRGYSQAQSATLSYSYIQQMANAIAAEHNVKIQVGKTWEVDLDNKTLTYNPTSMMFGSKGELLATLLHEVGKIKLCTPLHLLRSPKWYQDKWKQFAYLATVAFDDFRVDDTMINSYPSADEVYQSQEGTLLRVVESYARMSENYQQAVKAFIDHRVQKCISLLNDPQIRDYKLAYQIVFGCPPPPNASTPNELIAAAQKMNRMPQTNIYDYMQVMIYRGYGLNSKTVKISQEQDDLFKKTSGGIEKAIKQPSTQAVLDMMDTEVFPHIEHILEAMTNGSDDMKNAFGDGAAKDIAHQASSHMREMNHQGYDSPDVDAKGEMKSRGQLSGQKGLPKEWMEGDYNALKDSVSSEISSLVRKMTNLRRKENVIRYENNHRRGKLNSKTLYRHRLGSNRLFKKKLPNVDTVRSFVFSIMVDISGSMYSERIVHAVRGLIMLTEVFTKLGMPFEVIYFEDGARTIKAFDQTYDKKVKGKVSGVITANGGGTRLASALEISKIADREELNRVSVILTDGLCEDNEMLDSKYFIPLAKKNIKTIAIGLECGEEIKMLNMGQGRMVDNSAQMPEEFYNLLSATVLKK